MNIDTEKLAIHLAQMKIIEITAGELKVSNEAAIKAVFIKTENNKAEIINDLKEDYEDLINHYKSIIERHES